MNKEFSVAAVLRRLGGRAIQSIKANASGGLTSDGQCSSERSALASFLSEVDVEGEEVIPNAEWSGTVFVESLTSHPGYQLRQALLGGCLVSNGKPSGVVLLRRRSKELEALFRRFGFEEYIYQSDLINLKNAVAKSPKSLKLFKGINEKEDLLELEVNNIPIGRAVYNTYLRQSGKGSIDTLDEVVFTRILASLLYKGAFERLFNKHQITAVVQGETHYTPHLELGETALKCGIDVFSPQGTPEHMTVRRYSSGDSLKTNQFRILEEEVRWVEENLVSLAEEEGEAYMKSRVTANITAADTDARKAYSNVNQEASPGDWQTNANITTDRPSVCIFPHVMTDAVHSCESFLFNDYRTWYVSTLKIAASVSEVDWIVKPHPCEEFYEGVETAQEVFDATGPHPSWIHLVDAEISPRTLMRSVDAVITGRGTIGLEFPCFGIPAVLAGRSFYSGYGFTVDPQSRKEYVSEVRSIADVDPLSEGAIRRARIIAGIRYRLLGSKSDLIPIHSSLREIDSEEFWCAAVEQFNEVSRRESHDSFLAAFQRQISRRTAHLWSNEYDCPLLDESRTKNHRKVGEV